jgi:CRISPR/Cas system-associated exonuclease Cas4 (RecB family)
MVATQIADKVRCSAGKGILTKDECIACARGFKNTCGFDYTLIKEVLKDGVRTGIHVTDLTGCLRNAAYNKLMPPLEFVNARMHRFLGSALHAYLEDKDGTILHELKVEALGIEGSVDAFYSDVGRIIDFKTSRWLSPSKLPYGSHIQQVNIYAELLRRMGYGVNSAAVQYIDLTGPSKCRSCKVPYEPNEYGILICPACGGNYRDAHTGGAIFEVDLLPSEEVTEYIVDRRDKLNDALSTVVLPEAERSYLCGYCPFQQQCDTHEVAVEI